MPELPEVETIACKLRHSIVGKRIGSVSLSGKSLRRPMPARLDRLLHGRIIHEIHRRGKYLIIELKPRIFWLIHLGMSGSLLFGRKIADSDIHTHCRVWFTDQSELQFRDPRRFGLIDVAQAHTLDEIPEVQRLGRDPLSQEFAGVWLGKELRKTRRDLKSFLLDQHKITGIGNIYACEALFRARLHPERRCNTITDGEADALARAIHEVICDAVGHRGTSFSDFIDSDGAPGGHQDFLQVFQREGEKCRCCGARISRIRQGNRSTYFCAICQKAARGKN
jgi:formamidopyrimidine-DNA glycosylase